MGQVYFSDNIPDLVIGSTTTVTMAATYLGKETRITVGGQSNRYTSVATINFATTGLNALDAGSIAVNTLYYIYAVRSGTTFWKEIGCCRTLLGAATLGSTSASDDRSTAGRGILLRRPDGTLRELAIDNNDSITISTVP